MDKFLSDLSSPYFWLAVVLVGIAINLVSTLLLRTGGAFAASLPKWLRSRSAARRAKFERDVLKFVERSDLRVFLVSQEVRYRLMALFDVVVAYVIYTAPHDGIDHWLPATELSLGVGSVMIFTAMVHFLWANQAHELLREVEYRLRAK